jgi:hypothetical protein
MATQNEPPQICFISDTEILSYWALFSILFKSVMQCRKHDIYLVFIWSCEVSLSGVHQSMLYPYIIYSREKLDSGRQLFKPFYRLVSFLFFSWLRFSARRNWHVFNTFEWEWFFPISFLQKDTLKVNRYFGWEKIVVYRVLGEPCLFSDTKNLLLSEYTLIS